MSPDTVWGVLLGGFAGFVITWSIAFLVKLVRTPAVLYFEQKDRADKLQESLNQSLVDPVELKRQELVDREFLEFGTLEIEWLQRLLVSGRPAGMPNAALLPLERSGLIDRDFVGVKGIKEELKPAITRALVERNSLEHALEIIVSASSKYREAKTDPNGTTETIIVGIRNSHRTRRITNCEISITLPEDASAYIIRLPGSGFSLEAQEEKLIPVAYFREFAYQVPQPECIRIPMVFGTPYVQQSGLPTDPNFITLEATATETKPRQVRCKIWLDEQRRLQLEQVI